MIRCPRCHFLQPDENEFCSNCGRSFADMKCQSCGKKISRSATKCRHCGKSVATKPPVVCPKCKSEYPDGTKFCAKCGEVLKQDL